MRHGYENNNDNYQSMINIADLKNPQTGRTFREENNERQHNIPVGALIEIVWDEDVFNRNDNGIRLHVIKHCRDCDGTPLYLLGINGETKVVNGIAWNGFPGYPEYCLRQVQPTRGNAKIVHKRFK